MAEKRIAERIFKRLEVQFSTMVENTAITSNISKTGLFIRTNRGLAEGSTLNIKLNLPDSKELEVKGKVVRSSKTIPGLMGQSKSGMGIHLISPPVEYVDYVQSLL